MPTIDIHTHMLSSIWVDAIRDNGAPTYGVMTREDGRERLVERGNPTMTFEPEMFDYDLRLKDMDRFGVDVSVVSLTGPSVYWGSAEVSLDAARAINDDMASAQRSHPDRIRFLATLPWQYPEGAVEELAHAYDAGAVGVMVLANVQRMHLTDAHFSPIWQAIDDRSLPVLIHPTTPIGSEEMDLGRLGSSVGYTFDTSLAIARMIMDGFLDRYPNLALIASHGGGTLPYLASRIDLFHRFLPVEQQPFKGKPSEQLGRIYYDSILYDAGALAQCVGIGGPGQVLFGTDYPHPCDVPRLLELVDDRSGNEPAMIRGGNAERLFKL